MKEKRITVSWKAGGDHIHLKQENIEDDNEFCHIMAVLCGVYACIKRMNKENAEKFIKLIKQEIRRGIMMDPKEI